MILECGGIIYTIFHFLLTLLAFIILLVANAGSVKKSKGSTSIFLIELNFSDQSLSELVTNSGTTLSTMGNYDVYVFGMYGYCRGSSVNSTSTADQALYATSFNIESCTSPEPMYAFDPVQFIHDEVQTQLNVDIPNADIQFPSKVQSYISTAKNLSRGAYITSCIAIGLNFIVAILTIFLYFCSPGTALVIGVIESVAFFSALLASAFSTGSYRYLQSAFNSSFSSYGIYAKLSRNYMFLTWFGTILTLIVAVLLFVSCYCKCCCGFFVQKPELASKEEGDKDD